MLRLRQKAGLLRVDSTIAWISQQVEAEQQSACSVELVCTAADPVTERLYHPGLEVVMIYGQSRFDVEAKRLKFQTGQAKVCFFTTVSSISLHADETLEGGRQASTGPRVGVFHQAHFSDIAGRQVSRGNGGTARCGLGHLRRRHRRLRGRRPAAQGGLAAGSEPVRGRLSGMDHGVPAVDHDQTSIVMSRTTPSTSRSTGTTMYTRFQSSDPAPP